MSTDEIRKQIRAARRGMPPAYRAGASAKICDTVSQLESFQASEKIAGYLAFDGEADPLGLMIRATELGKQVYVPVVVEKGKPLRFAPWSRDCRMQPNRFGISEPDVDEDRILEAPDLDFVITPLVAFDQTLNRLGVGGGFYDCTFAFARDLNRHSAPRLVGFAFEMQKVPQLRPQRWDVPLASVVTEVGIYEDA